MALTTKQSKFDYDAAWHLFLAGASFEEVARMCEIPQHVLMDYGRRHYWAKRRANATKHARKAITDDLNRRLESARAKHQSFMLDQLEHTALHIENTDIGQDKDSGQIPVEAKLNLLDKQDLIARRVMGMDKEEKRDPVEIGFAMLVAMGRQAQQALVNENEIPMLHDEPKQLPLKVIMKEPEQSEEVSLTEQSAPSTQPEHQDPLTGILSPFNGHINAMETTSETQIPEAGALNPTAGPQEEQKPYSPPQPLVNENEDQPTDE